MISTGHPLEKTSTPTRPLDAACDELHSLINNTYVTLFEIDKLILGQNPECVDPCPPVPVSQGLKGSIESAVSTARQVLEAADLIKSYLV